MISFTCGRSQIRFLLLIAVLVGSGTSGQLALDAHVSANRKVNDRLRHRQVCLYRVDKEAIEEIQDGVYTVTVSLNSE